MPDRNAERLTPDMQRLGRHLVGVKEEIKRLEAEEDSLAKQMGTLAANEGLHEGDNAGFSYDGLNMVVPAGAIDNKITDLLRRKQLWHCMSYQAKAAVVEEAIEAGKLTEAEVAPFRKTRDPWFSLSQGKK